MVRAARRGRARIKRVLPLLYRRWVAQVLLEDYGVNWEEALRSCLDRHERDAETSLAEDDVAQAERHALDAGLIELALANAVMAKGRSDKLVSASFKNFLAAREKLFVLAKVEAQPPAEPEPPEPVKEPEPEPEPEPEEDYDLGV